MAGPPGDPCKRVLNQTPWLEQVALDPPVSRLSTVQLGQGEAEVLEWALRHPEFVALLDDRAARRVAEVLGVRCAGTLRVLYEASLRNHIPSFAEGVARLQAAGLHCDQRTIDLVYRQIAKAPIKS
jgi:predicted nucleic acid-binding protein